MSEHGDRTSSWEQFRSWPGLVQILLWLVAPWAVILIWIVHKMRHQGLAMKVATGALALGLLVAAFVNYINASGSAHEVMFPSVDDPVLAQQIDSACPDQPGEEADLEAVLASENEALARFVDALERMDDQRVEEDRPVAAWVDDWRSLLAARVAYHERIQSDRDAPRPPIPTVDGYSIALRMSEMSGVDCKPTAWVLDDFDTSGAITTRQAAG